VIMSAFTGSIAQAIMPRGAADGLHVDRYFRRSDDLVAR
jgi:hypothetical protein